MSGTGKKKASISVKISTEDKQRATELFEELGLSLPTAIRIFIKKSIAAGGLPFEVEDSFYSATNQAELNRRFTKVANNRHLHDRHLLDNPE